MLAHIGPKDMRIAISYALHGAASVESASPPLDLVQVGALTFEPVDLDAFPCLRLAREAAQAGGTAPCVLNAANEIAVHAFLAGRLPFLGIAEVIERTLELQLAWYQPVRAFESLYEADREGTYRGRADVARSIGGWSDKEEVDPLSSSNGGASLLQVRAHGLPPHQPVRSWYDQSSQDHHFASPGAGQAGTCGCSQRRGSECVAATYPLPWPPLRPVRCLRPRDTLAASGGGHHRRGRSAQSGGLCVGRPSSRLGHSED